MVHYFIICCGSQMTFDFSDGYLQVKEQGRRKRTGAKRRRQTARRPPMATLGTAQQGPARKTRERPPWMGKGGRQSQSSTHQRRENHQTKELNPPYPRQPWTEPPVQNLFSIMSTFALHVRLCTKEWIMNKRRKQEKKGFKKKRTNQYLYLLIMIKKWIELCQKGTSVFITALDCCDLGHPLPSSFLGFLFLFFFFKYLHPSISCQSHAFKK